ncbi:hypothetical protein BaRGS_00015114 [Batillaria attramentaria]|uniref:Uncharacterized protein n=1 Tax=Batillaria attramentaria TaxID=370345 RepID=A0ABD0L3J3_9CAEN
MEWKILAYRVGIILMKPLFHRSDDVLDKFLPGDDPEPYEMKIDALLTKFVWVTICCRRSLGTVSFWRAGDGLELSACHVLVGSVEPVSCFAIVLNIRVSKTGSQC